MGSFFDRIKDNVTDSLAQKTDKVQVGFEPAVCEGCVHRGGPPLRRCELCGCPTLDGFPLDTTGMVPKGCPRIPAHERESSE